MDNILKISERNQKRAKKIIEDLKIIEIWESVGAEINLVGSLKTGLLMNRRDIDFHIYTNNFDIKDSFKAISLLAENKRIAHIEYTNLLDTEEACLEWHAKYKDISDEFWQIDMIHILRGTKYAGWFESVAERINSVLTLETRLAILSIKNEIPENEKIMGIEIYKAVIQDGIRNCKDFLNWRKKQSFPGIIEWIP